VLPVGFTKWPASICDCCCHIGDSCHDGDGFGDTVVHLIVSGVFGTVCVAYCLCIFWCVLVGMTILLRSIVLWIWIVM
jgi:hypothetical protein